MPVSRSEALAAARKLLRMFGSAPDPRRRAREFYSELAQAEGWTAHEQSAIEGFGAWVLGAPPTAELRLRAEHLFAALADDRPATEQPVFRRRRGPPSTLASRATNTPSAARTSTGKRF